MLPKVYEFGPFRLDNRGRPHLLRDARTVPLPAKVLKLLSVLMDREGRAITREELLMAVWPEGIAKESTLMWSISVLRKALGEHAADPRYIETIPKLGYRFMAEIQESSSEPVTPSEAVISSSAAGVASRREIQVHPPPVNLSHRESQTDKAGDAIASADVDAALKLLAESTSENDNFSLTRADAFRLLAYVAWAIDIDYEYLELVGNTLPTLQRISKSSLTLRDLAYLEFTEGAVSLHSEDHDDAAMHLTRAMIDADRVGDADLMTLTRYYLARCYWRRGTHNDYEQALIRVREAKKLADDSKRETTVAVLETLEGWLLFSMGDVKGARKVLEHAKGRLEGAGSHFLYANLMSCFGRLYCNSGQYAEALRSFGIALAHWSEFSPRHANVARCHLEIASATGFEVRRIESMPVSPEERFALRSLAAELRSQALDHLDCARKIIENDANRNPRLCGKLHNIAAQLHLDSDELKGAASEAEVAYRIGIDANDWLVTADSMIVQSAIALEIGSEPEAVLASALKAVEYANQTGNRRLKSRAYISLGLATLDTTPTDLNGARQCYEAAKELLLDSDRDQLREFLDLLGEEINLRMAASPAIVSLTAADVEGSDLASILGKVEHSLIRYVFEQSRGSISRTARELQTSRRRVLRAIRKR